MRNPGTGDGLGSFIISLYRRDVLCPSHVLCGLYADSFLPEPLMVTTPLLFTSSSSLVSWHEQPAVRSDLPWIYHWPPPVHRHTSEPVIPQGNLNFPFCLDLV